jgi:hypothetical protein
MTEQQKFDQAMKKILSVSKQELQKRIEEEKKTKQLPVGSRPANTNSRA